MVYIKDIPSMGYTCRADLICTLRKNFAVIFTYTSERISLVIKIYIKNPPARSIPHILTRKTLQLYVSTI